MKKNLSAVLLAIAIPALASASDINPGALQLSGKSAFDFSATTAKVGAVEVDTTKLGGGLSAMYYVSKFLAFGLATEYDKTTTSIAGLPSETDSTFLFGPKAGIDYELMEHFSVFADLTVGMAQMTNTADATGSGLGWAVGGGFKLFLNQNVSLDLMGSYKRVSVDLTGGKVTDSGFTTGIGFSFYLTNTPVNSEDYRPPPPAPAPPAYR
jgi:opacity protein-like surface antigen